MATVFLQGRICKSDLLNKRHFIIFYQITLTKTVLSIYVKQYWIRPFPLRLNQHYSNSAQSCNLMNTNWHLIAILICISLIIVVVRGFFWLLFIVHIAFSMNYLSFSHFQVLLSVLKKLLVGVPYQCCRYYSVVYSNNKK